MNILIDNGHGINTSGKRSPDGKLLEYRYTREIARMVVSRLCALGFKAQLLVPETEDISLNVRCRRVNSLCNRVGAHNVMLVSIHLNAAGQGRWMKARGWEVWTSPGQTQGDRLADCLYETAQRVLPTGTPIRTDFTDGDCDKEAKFTILTNTRCAACLTENLFQDNLEDVSFLLSDRGKEALTSLHVNGIINYIKSLS